MAFPEKPEKEIIRIQKAFYKSFCDQWIETLKLISMPLDEVDKRITGDWKVFNEAALRGNGKIVVGLGHLFNWEIWNLAIPLHFQHQFSIMYLPIKSKIADRLFLYIRQRSGGILIPANNLYSDLKKIENIRHILAFSADQNPGSLKVAQWALFMNRPAPFLTGLEKIALKKNAAVVWMGLQKIKRGYYKMNVELFCTETKNLQQGDIVKSYVNFLERQIEEQPENWMWSHRRWKIPAPEGLDFDNN